METMKELESDLVVSIDRLTRYLNGIREDITNGIYTAAKAQTDYDCLTNSEGIDIYSLLEAIAETEEDN